MTNTITYYGIDSGIRARINGVFVPKELDTAIMHYQNAICIRAVGPDSMKECVIGVECILDVYRTFDRTVLYTWRVVCSHIACINDVKHYHFAMKTNGKDRASGVQSGLLND